MVHEFRRVSIVYRNVIDSFPANAKRRRLPHPPPFLSFRQLTLEKVGQVKRYVRYEATSFSFSFFLFFSHVRDTWNFARRSGKSTIEHTVWMDNEDKKFIRLVNVDVGSTP